MRIWSLLIALLVVTGFSSPLRAEPPDCAELEKQIAELTKRIEALESKHEPKKPKPAAPRPATPAAKPERKIDPLYGKIDGLLAEGKIDEAQQAFQARKATGEVSSVMNVLTREMAVVGMPTPEWDIEKWFQGELELDLDGPYPTLLIFWEAWCPYCKTELPKLREVYANYKDQGLQVLGLTRITRTATEESVKSFLADSGVDYPIAKETGSLYEYFNVKGIPAAAVVKDGTVIWRGHPQRLTEEMLKGWL